MTSPLRFASLHPRQGARTPARREDFEILPQELFARTLFVERKRTERSGRSFVLMLFESEKLLKPEGDGQALENLLFALSRSTRDTDSTGWLKKGSTLGVIFTELGAGADGRAIAKALLSKVMAALTDSLTLMQISQIRITFHIFPDDLQEGSPADGAEASFYDGLLHPKLPGKGPRMAKRFMDIAGSLAALFFCTPLIIVIAIAIKLTSRGPVFFSQQRVGQYGKKFNFMKFRSMKVNNDATIHKEYVKKFISNQAGENGTSESATPFKIAADPRITPIGQFLRKSSLDELPQLINVLMGEMSLVGPRPPLPYEAEHYHAWHRTRLLAAKPGITGLWQVEGRSRVKFDDMVRMDLRYAATWSLWLDIKILLQTPQAVLSANGAR